MATEETNQNEYGYESDEVKVSPFNFGLNASNTFLTKFEWTPSGGKEGAELEALDIVFNINSTLKNYRLFPITKAFLKGGGETTDRNSQEFKDEVKDFNAKVFHILHCFVDDETYKIATSKRIASFKDFCTIVAALLPKDFDKKPLDVFLQYQWSIGKNNNRTYLELPSKMKHGKWVVAAVKGNWTRNVVENASDEIREALSYTNEQGEKHPFTRTGWFMNSNFATQQREEGSEGEEDNKEQEQGSSEEIKASANGSASPDTAKATQNAASATTETW